MFLICHSSSCLFFLLLYNKLELKIKFPIQSGGLVGYVINTSLPFGELKFAVAFVSAIIVALFPYVFLVFGKKTRKQIEKENKNVSKEN